MSVVHRSTISRRHALKTGGFAALAASLLAPTNVAAAPPVTVAAVVDSAPLRAAADAQVVAMQRADRALAAIEDALWSQLTPVQRQLLDEYQGGMADLYTSIARLQIIEVARHFPGLAPALVAMWDHVDGSDGSQDCCL